MNCFAADSDEEPGTGKAPLAKPDPDNVSEGEPVKSLDEPEAEPVKSSDEPEGGPTKSTDQPEGEPIKSSDELEAAVCNFPFQTASR